ARERGRRHADDAQRDDAPVDDPSLPDGRKNPERDADEHRDGGGVDSEEEAQAETARDVAPNRVLRSDRTTEVEMHRMPEPDSVLGKKRPIEVVLVPDSADHGRRLLPRPEEQLSWIARRDRQQA